MNKIFSQKHSAAGYAEKVIFDTINESNAAEFTFNVENKGSLVYAGSFKKTDDIKREVELAVEFANFDWLNGKQNNVLILFER